MMMLPSRSASALVSRIPLKTLLGQRISQRPTFVFAPASANSVRHLSSALSLSDLPPKPSGYPNPHLTHNDRVSIDTLAANGWKVMAWKDDTEALQKTIKFKKFSQSIAFVNAIAEIARKERHHPHITIDFDTVVLTSITHSAFKPETTSSSSKKFIEVPGITVRDVRFAMLVDHDLSHTPHEVSKP